ncbi:MAG: type IV pilus assembly protein PilM [Lentisphaeria bacterium]
MSRSNRILAVDIGAASIKIAEFEYPATGGIVLAGFDYREYGEEISEDNRSFVITSVLQDLLQDNAFSAHKAMVCISGQFALTRFVKLPPVAEEESRVRQIVEFEARQNVPFPMEEVIWDYQLIANPEAEELEVMFVVIKNEIVGQITDAVQQAGLTTLLVDVAPCACYNAARANDIGDQECEMILNIGDRSTNLLFADRQQFFARTIPIAGHTITQQIAKEFGIDMAEAEELKRRHGFVALGGAYAEPESEVASAVSKIVRNVMTRLHGEINRSIGVYRAQQKGSKPVRMFLTGGSSTMTYTDVFFNEKLNMDVEFLNPFKVVQLAPGVDADRLQEVAHTFSEVIGLGLRYKRQLPVEVSLIPENVQRQMSVRQKKPYFVACIACILLMLSLALLGSMRETQIYKSVYEQWQGDVERLKVLDKKVSSRTRTLTSLKEDYSEIYKVLKRREKWLAMVNEIGRLCPEHLWVYELQPIAIEPEIEAEGNNAKGNQADDQPAGAGIFGGGVSGGQPSPPPGASELDEIKGELQPKLLTGVVLRGHSLVVKEADEKIENNGNADGDGVGGTANADDVDEVLTQNNTGASEDTPEQIFERRLQNSALFDESETRIETYTAHEKVENLIIYTLRIKLNTPLSVNYPEDVGAGVDE